MAFLDSVGSFLAAQNLVNGGTGWALFKGYVPETPNKCVVLSETGGFEPEDRSAIDYPTFQVFVRGEPILTANAYKDARERIELIYHALHEGDVPDGAFSPPTYFVYCLAIQSAALALGQDNVERPRFSQNFKVMRNRG